MRLVAITEKASGGMTKRSCRKGRLFRLIAAAVLFAVNGITFAQEQTSGAVAQTAPLYAEPHRPQVHFSPPSMWMNDPNGLVWFKGEYHLFYQYYPDDKVWGPMHWGHAVSTDLVHWKNLPVALYPDKLGYIFSGSAVVDRDNTSGFGRNGQPPLVAIYTYHDAERAKARTQDHEYQGIAYSNDRGRTWTKYKGNPVLPNENKQKDFRDPKVFWHEASGKWVMALSANDHVEFWGSPDLKSWNHLSDFGRAWGAHGGVWECPDLVEMKLAGGDGSRWVLIQNLNPGGPQGGSGTQYFVGDFDGAHYTLDESFKATLQQEGAVWLDAGPDDYAGVTWSGVPREDGRTLFIGWMGNWNYAQKVPTDPWRSAMTLPRELTLHRTSAGLRVFSRPVAELQRLRGASSEIGKLAIMADSDVPLATAFPVAVSEVIVEFELPEAGEYDLGIQLSNDIGERFRVGYDGGTGELYMDRTAAGDSSFAKDFAGVHRTRRLSESRVLRLHLFFDVASAELFADDGANVMTEIFFPTMDYSHMSFYSNGAGVRVLQGRVFQLTGIWQ